MPPEAVAIILPLAEVPEGFITFPEIEMVTFVQGSGVVLSLAQPAISTKIEAASTNT